MAVVAKQILAPGRYWAQHRLTGEPLPVEFTAADCQAFCNTGNAMLRHGWTASLPLEHQESADPLPWDQALARRVSHNTGRARGYWIDPSDKSLWGSLEVTWLPDTPPDQIEEALRTRIQFVSPDLHPSLTLGDGSTWKHAIRHIALTTTPIDFRQKPFGSTSTANRTSMSMAPGTRVFEWRRMPRAVRLSMANRIVARPTRQQAEASAIARQERGGDELIRLMGLKPRRR